MALLFEEKLLRNKAAFIKRVGEIANLLKCNPNDLMVVMYAESGLNEKAYNSNGGASGLIQFMPSTASWLGTTTAALRAMTNVQQLEYVYKYFRTLGATGKMKSVYDVYMFTFFPIGVGKPDTWILQSSDLSANTVAVNNKIIDLDKDKKITVAEFKKYIDNFLVKKGIDLKKIKGMKTIDILIIAAFILLGVMVGYKIFKG